MERSNLSTALAKLAMLIDFPFLRTVKRVTVSFVAMTTVFLTILFLRNSQIRHLHSVQNPAETFDPF